MEAVEIREATRVVEAALRQKMPSSFHESLMSGVRLCMLFISLFPLRRRPKFRSGRPDFYESNILSFLQAAAAVISPTRLFEPHDLLLGSSEGLLKVARSILALAQASGRSFPPPHVFAPPLAPAAGPLLPPRNSVAASINMTMQAVSDTVSVGSSGSSTTDWCRVDSLSLSSPQQHAMSPLSPRDSWVQISRFDGFGE